MSEPISVPVFCTLCGIRLEAIDGAICSFCVNEAKRVEKENRDRMKRPSTQEKRPTRHGIVRQVHDAAKEMGALKDFSRWSKNLKKGVDK